MSSVQIFLSDSSPMPGFLKVGDRVPLSPDQWHHLFKVRRGRDQNLFVGAGKKEGIWVAERFQNDFFIKGFLSRKTEPEFRLILAFGVPSKEKISWIIPKGTELGVTDFFPLRLEFVQGENLHYWEKKRERILNLVDSAACQSRRNLLPTLHPPSSLEEFFSTLKILEPTFKGFALHPEGENEKKEKNESCDNSPPWAQALLVGPAGGFSTAEIQKIKSMENFKTLNLGARILRFETAVVCGLSGLVYFSQFRTLV